MTSPPTDTDTNLPLTFVVGTGRCGSTLVSEILDTHPAVLSLSEFFVLIGPGALPGGRVDGESFARVLTAPQLWRSVPAMAGLVNDEVRYPLERINLTTPPLLLMCLPRLSDDPDALLDDAVAFARTLPPADIATQYRRLFAWLAARFGRRVVVERSGASLPYAGTFARHFPEARFVHLHRDGRAAALSMSHHPSFRLLIARKLLADAIGFDPYDEPERPIPASLPEELACVLPDRFDADAFLRLPLPLEQFGRYWSASVMRGLRALDALPAERVLHLSYEELVERPVPVLERLLGFTGLTAPSPDWLAAAAARVERRPSAWTELPAAERAALEEACAPGMERLARSSRPAHPTARPANGTRRPQRRLPPGPRRQRRAERRWVDDLGGLLLDCRQRYGEVFTLPAPGVHGPKPTRVVVTGDPHEVYEVLRVGSMLNRGGDCRERTRRFVGDESLFMLEGAAHLHRRRLVLPHFHRRAVEGLVRVIGDITDREIDTWPVGEPFALSSAFSALSFAVLSLTVFGIDDELWQARLWRAIRRTAQAWHGPRVVDRQDLEARADLDRLIYEQIVERRGRPPRDDADDFLSSFVHATDEDGVPLTDEQVHDEVLTLLLAGNESVAVTLAWAFTYLFDDPLLVAELRDEASRGESRAVDALVQEVLRLHPPVPVAVRTLAVPWTLGGHDLEPGTAVAPAIWLAHRSAESYDDPLAFRSDRFLGSPPNPQTWVPYGVGVRRCLGATLAAFELRVVLQRILLRADLEPGGIANEGGWVMIALRPGEIRAVLRSRRDVPVAV